VLRTELGGQGLYVDDFEHVARWNPAHSRIEMWLRAKRDVHVHFDVLGQDWELPAGAEMLTEISTKFALPELRDELRSHGLEPLRSWMDDARDYSLTLARAIPGDPHDRAAHGDLRSG
jgi:L-histidine N-alpha-methyltransferase